MPAVQNAPVLIVGAGPTGLVLALWLTKLGVPVRIVDRAAEPGTTSRALAVQARTLEFHRQVGLSDAVVAEGVRVAGLNLWVAGEKRARLPLATLGEGETRFPAPVIFPQDAHERLLIERLAGLGVTVERPVTLETFDQDTHGVRVRLTDAAGEAETLTVAYLAGCDGARSAVRHGLGSAFEGGTYDDVFYVADVEASGPADDDEIHIDLDRSDFVAMFPLKVQGRMRLVGSVRAADPDQVVTFEDVAAEPLRSLKLDVARVNWFSTYRVHHRVASRFRDRRVFLVGDAAHIHSPVGGQGMNTGVGDAVNLAWKLAAVLKGEANPHLLDSYEPERIGFARQLVATTDRAFTLVSARGAFAGLARTRVVPRLAPLLFRFEAARRRLFATVSQLGVNYREGPLSDGEAGAVRGGDRLPWLPADDGSDNFEPLAELCWQVHVYGAPSAGLTAACKRASLPLHAFAWTERAARAGLLQDAAYLVRPDGYVALADPAGEGARLGCYLSEHGVQLTAAS